MIKQLFPSILLTLVLTLILGLGYPLLMTAVSQRLFPVQAHGSLLVKNGQIVGSPLIGQVFTKAEYFHPRPSATTTADPQDASKTVPLPYNAASSAASNATFTAKAQMESLAANAQALKDENPQAVGEVPSDLITASASGLDPHISPEGALFQAARIAAARHAEVTQIQDLIAQNSQGRLWGLFGAPVVNVLDLNLKLDERWPLR